MGLFATTTGMSVMMVGTVFDTVTTNLASTCIGLAEDEVRKNLSNMYDLSTNYFNTTTSIPPMVRNLTLQLAVGYAYENMARGSKEGYARADRYMKRVNDNLKSLADGTLQLFDTAGALIIPTKTKWQVACNTSDYQLTFDEDNPKNWRVDPDKLDDIADSRDTGSVDSNEID